MVDNNLTPCVDSLTDNETLASLHANDTRDEATRSRNCEPADWRPEEFEEKRYMTVINVVRVTRAMSIRVHFI